MTENRIQICNTSFDLIYVYHDDSYALTLYLENGDTDILNIPNDSMADFLGVCEAVAMLKVGGKDDDD